MIDADPYVATVAARVSLSPHLVRLTLRGARQPDGSPFVGTGRPDEFVALAVPGHDDVHRYYTIRAHRPEADELDIEFVLHGPGPAASWAAGASAGEQVTFTSPRGHYLPPAEAEWIGIVGDATALPAIARLLEERTTAAPATTPVHAAVLLEDERDRIDLPVHPGDTLDWLTAEDDLVTATRSIVARPGHGYLWFSGEASDMRAVRRHLRAELAWPTRRWTTMAYWRRDSTSWRRRFESHGPALLAEFEAIYATDEDPELQRDRADALLERHGL